MNTSMMNQYKYLAKDGDGALAFHGSVPCYLPSKANGCYESENGSLMFYGKCVQNGTPSPSSPVAVEYVDGDGRIGVQQLVENGNFVDASGLRSQAPSYMSFYVANNIVTTTYLKDDSGEGRYSWGLRFDISKVYSQHKYLFFVTIKPTVTSNYGTDNIGGVQKFSPQAIGGQWNKCYILWQADRDYPDYKLIISPKYYGIQAGQTAQMKNVMLIDLTAMYGAGNEPSTVEQFKQMYPADYYACMYGTTLTMPDLYGIGDIRDTYEPCVWVNGALRSRLTRRIGVISSYNGESVGSVYMSSTGELSTGATVYYPLATPVITLGDPQPVQSYGGATNIFHTSTVQPKISATVVTHS